MDLEYEPVDSVENRAIIDDADRYSIHQVYSYGYDEYSEEDTGNDTHDDAADAIADRAEQWTRLRINGDVIMISSHGRFKPYGDSLAAAFEGTAYPGTPYRYIVIGRKHCFVHDLVWLAFVGTVPDGKEVRHDPYYVSLRSRKHYSNSIDYLTVLPKVVCDVHAIM